MMELHTRDVHAVVIAHRDVETLRPLTERTCAALLPVAGKPLLEHTLESLVLAGVRSGSVVVGPHAEQVERFLASLSGGFTDLNPADNVVRFVTTVVSPEPPVLTAAISNGLLQLSGSGQPGLQYVIEASTGLASWSAISTNTAGTDGIPLHRPQHREIWHAFLQGTSAPALIAYPTNRARHSVCRAPLWA